MIIVSMSGSSPRTMTVTIPAARSLLGETEPAEFLNIPLVVRTGFRDRQLLGVVILVMVFASLKPWEGLPAAAFGVALHAVLGLVAVRVLLAVALALAEWLRPGPTLMLDDVGVRDRRSGAAVTWSSIAAAEIVTPIFNVSLGILGVRLHLREPSPQPRVSPFWDGALLPALRQEPGQLYVPVTFLDRPARPLAMAIAAMVRLNGGRTSVTGMGTSDELLKASVGREPDPN